MEEGQKPVPPGKGPSAGRDFARARVAEALFDLKFEISDLKLTMGTGSSPQSPQGWQRQRRRSASQHPRAAPCNWIA